MKRGTETVELIARFTWALVLCLLAWATAPKLQPEKVKVEDLRGAAKYQARVWERGGAE